jgi:hypothetical protein
MMDLESVGLEDVFHEPNLLDADHFLFLSGMMKPDEGAQTRRSSTRGIPRGLFGRNDLMAAHSEPGKRGNQRDTLAQ